AHEIGHAVNTYHHGEAKNKDYDQAQGPRSGDVTCIMRYDNLKNVFQCMGLPEVVIGRKKGRPEPVGTIFCTTSSGTGYNAGGQCFGDCAAGRGKCKEQFRVSGRSASYPKR
ncbi:MAG: hypothetical protein R3301_19855, partial [Saprospiraceae bacterium]|nr:hypothetical protein [Saprospiraceae bacterium]